MTKIRINLITDTACLAYDSIIAKALEQIKKDYEDATLGELTVEFFGGTQSLAGLPWESYTPQGDLGVAFSWITKQAALVKSKDLVGYDNICFVIDQTNWKSPTTWGWNLGTFYSGYQIQLIRGAANSDALYKTFKMEIFHMMDDIYSKRTGRSLDQFFGGDFDEDIVHIKDSEGFYTFEFAEPMSKMKDLLVGMFARKQDYVHLTDEQKDAIKISILQKIIVYLKQWLSLVGPTAVYTDFKHKEHKH